MNEKRCLACELTRMMQEMSAIYSFVEESTREKGLEKDFKASFLDIAFHNAAGSIIILREMFNDFAIDTGWGTVHESGCESDIANA